MPNRILWNPDYSMGNDILDNQHRAILAQCNALADCITNAAPDCDLRFSNTFTALMAQAGEHFSTEAALLSQCAYPLLEEHLVEHDEFDYLANEIITTENFEQVELQRFLALWWVGHIVGSGKQHSPYLAKLQST